MKKKVNKIKTNEDEKNFFLDEYKDLEEQLKIFRNIEEDNFLRADEKKYFITSNITSFKRVKFI